MGYGLQTFGDSFLKKTGWKQEEGKDDSQAREYKMFLSCVERNADFDIKYLRREKKMYRIFNIGSNVR